MTFWVYMFDTDRIVACYTYEDDIDSDILGIVAFDSDNKVYAWDGVTKTEIMAAYNKEQWYKIRIVQNLAGNTYDVEIDDNLEADDFDFYSGAATTFKSTKLTTGKGLATGTMGYVDDVTIGEVTEVAVEEVQVFWNGLSRGAQTRHKSKFAPTLTLGE